MNLPWAYIAAAIVSAVIMLAYGRWIAPLDRHRQIQGSLAVVAGSLVLFWLALKQPTAWSAGAFYVWVNVFSLFLVSQFFLVVNDLFDPRQGKRLLGFVGAGGLAGGVAGSAGAGFLARPLGSENLLLLGAVLLVVCAGLAERVFRIGRFRTSRPQREPDEDQGITGGLRILQRVRHMRRIAVVLFLGTLTVTFVDWMFNAAVEAAIPGQDAQTRYFGRVFAVFNGVALVIQLFFASFALRFLGLAGSLVVLPVAVGLGVGGLLAAPGLLTATLARAPESTFRNSLDQSARELLYLPVPTVLKRRVKPFIDIVVQRGADGLAGLLILAGSGFMALRGPGLKIVTLVLIAVWIGAVWGVRRSYRQILERLLAVRDVDLEEAVEESLDSETIRALREELGPGGDAERIQYTLDLFREVPARVLQDDLLRLLDHADPRVRSRALGALATIEEGVPVESVRRLAADTDQRVQARAYRVLCTSDPEEYLPQMETWLDSEEPDRVEAAIVCLVRYGGEEGEEKATEALSRLVRRVGDEGAPTRAACARALGHLGGLHSLQKHLGTLLSDSSPEVVRAAIVSAGQVPRPDLIGALLPHLGAISTRPLAVRALSAYGEPGIPYLSAALRDPELSEGVRRWLPSVFVQIPSPASLRALAEGLPSLSRESHRLYALKALGKLRRRYPRWTIPVEAVREELDAELEESYDIERQLVALRAIARDLEGEDAGMMGAYAWALGFQAERTIERAFRLQALLYSQKTIYFAYAGLTSGASMYGAHALELLETVLDRADARRLIPLIDPDWSTDQRVEVGRRWYPLEDREPAEDLEAVLEEAESWLTAYAVPVAARAYPERLGPELERLAASGDPIVRRLARRYEKEREEEGAMAMSSVEKAAALRRTGLLSQLGADDLLQLAAVAEERTFDAGEFLFYEGEEGDYLYVVLAGTLRAEKAGQEVTIAGPGEAIGTFSVLDGGTRSTDMVAIETTRTLAIHRADMAQILADNYSLVEGLFKHLTGIIREMNERVFSDEGGPPEVKPPTG
ncbi:MAG: HEAT repeat domain-containing protein [Gemmatimonadota bacterium]